MMDRAIHELNEEEQAWIVDQLDRARAFVLTWIDGFEGDPTALEVLDRAFSNFLLADDRDRDLDSVAVLAVGVAFGDNLVRRLGFRWVMVTDAHGTDFAVIARPGRGDVTICPTDFTAKRYDRGETGFLEASMVEIEAILREVAEQWGDPG